jgi:hypothetical protein
VVKTCQEVLSFALVVVLVLSALSVALSYREAFADGFTQENLPPASLAGRSAQLFVKINPPILTTASQQDAYMQLRLYDSNNNQTIKNTAYYIEVTKGTSSSAKSLMHDTFLAENGLLTLKIQPTEGQLTVFGNQDPFTNAWVADPGGTVNIRGPLLLDGGLYHFHIEIVGIDKPGQGGLLDTPTKFDSWLSVGDVSAESYSYNGQSYNATIISYYDKVQDFKFDSAKKTFTWAMPFDWNASRIKANNIFVHEEVRIPKSLQGIGDSPYFAAIANGEILTGRKLAIDPYTSESEMTLHYLLNKDDILQMANKAGDTAQMTFSLAPASEAPAETTGEMVTDIGGVGVSTEWSPNPLNADKASTVKLHFSDAFSGGPLNADVLYSMNILDNGGKSVYSKDNLTAKGGTDTQTIDFPSNEKYNVQVTVKGLVKEGQQVDQTRNGIARGTVIVPEFPASAVLVMTGLIAAALLAQRFVIARRPQSGMSLW